MTHGSFEDENEKERFETRIGKENNTLPITKVPSKADEIIAR